MKISRKIPLISTTIIVLAFALFSYVQYSLVSKRLYEQTQNNVSETSRALSAELSNWLNQRLAIIQGMSEIISSKPYVTKQWVKDVMATPRFNEDFTLFFGALDVDGKPLSNKEGYNPKGWDGRKRPWWKVAKYSNKAMMTDPYIGHTTQKLLISAVANMYENGQFVGAFGGDIELDTVSNAVNAVNFNNTGYAFLVDDKSDIITHPDKKLYKKNISQMFQGERVKLLPKLQASMIDNVPVYTSFYKLEGFTGSKRDWYIGVVLYKDKVLEPATKLGLLAIIGAILTAILSSLLFYLFMKNTLISPVEVLTEQSDKISRGELDLEMAGVDRTDEVGDLAKALDRLRKSLKMAMDSLTKK